LSVSFIFAIFTEQEQIQEMLTCIKSISATATSNNLFAKDLYLQLGETQKGNMVKPALLRN
jgi:hypothetical protein